MKIALIGPSELSPFDEQEITKYIDAVARHHEVVILAYRSIEKQIFKFYVNNSELCSNLTIYTFQELNDLPSNMRAPIDYLINQGALYLSFGYDDMVVRRSTYEDAWAEIANEADMIVSFYDRKNAEKLLIPVDVAKKMYKKSFIYYLSGDTNQSDVSPDKKMRVIDPTVDEFYA